MPVTLNIPKTMRERVTRLARTRRPQSTIIATSRKIFRRDVKNPGLNARIPAPSVTSHRARCCLQGGRGQTHPVPSCCLTAPPYATIGDSAAAIPATTVATRTTFMIAANGTRRVLFSSLTIFVSFEVQCYRSTFGLCSGHVFRRGFCREAWGVPLASKTHLARLSSLCNKKISKNDMNFSKGDMRKWM